MIQYHNQLNSIDSHQLNLLGWILLEVKCWKHQFLKLLILDKQAHTVSCLHKNF